MKTINQTLAPTDYAGLGHWIMWTNDVLNRLDGIRIIPKRKIPVNFTPSEFTSQNGYEWDCQHASTYPDTIEIHDEYLEAVSGIPQPVYYEKVEICNGCGAQYNYKTEEWYND